MKGTPPEGQTWTLERLREVYPWPEGWEERGHPQEVLWTFDLDAGREAFWPHVTDTSAINRGLRLPQIDFAEVDGRLHATMGGGLARSEWVEVPWQWEYGRWMSYERIYSKGLPHFIRTLNVFEQPEPGKTRMVAYTGMVARSWFGKKIFSAYMKGLRSKYQTLLDEMVALSKAGSALGRRADPQAAPAEGRARAGQIREGLVEAGEDANVVDTLVKHVLEADELELHRLRVRSIARRYSVDQDVLLRACLGAARDGLLLLRWDVTCPHCRGLRGEIDHLGDVPARGSCEPCGIDFETSDVDVMELTFRVHPQIRDIPDRVYCAAEPATKHHIRVQRTVEPGDAFRVDTLLSRGRYRMRLLGSEEDSELDLSGDEESSLVWKASEKPEIGVVAPRPVVELQNDTTESQTFVIDEHERDREALRPADVFSVQTFRDVYASEHLGVGVALDVGVQTILFTDVVGSTRFYLDEGDAAAFVEIRKQFVLAYPIVEKHDGVVVKTIGDAIMAAFRSPVDAVKASIELQQLFTGETKAAADELDCCLRIRITLHTGPCLAVNLNTGIDYFGTTVNLAAKIQSQAEAGEVTWTIQVDEDPEVAALMKSQAFPSEVLEFELAGQESTTLRRVTVS